MNSRTTHVPIVARPVVGTDDDRSMWDTTSRTFEMLGMLQRNGFVASERLADDLGVTTRTVRRDVARLRDLGYPIDTRLGVDGGYSIEPGAVLPPIFLSPDEALACALAIRRWKGGSDRTLATSSLSKVLASLPPRIRWLVDAVAEVTIEAAVDGLEPIDHPLVDIALLGELARSCLLQRRVQFRHTQRNGGSKTKKVDPHVLVNTAQRWYLVHLPSRPHLRRRTLRTADPKARVPHFECRGVGHPAAQCRMAAGDRHGQSACARRGGAAVGRTCLGSHR
jgi:biotin operon repressor